MLSGVRFSDILSLSDQWELSILFWTLNTGSWLVFKCNQIKEKFKKNPKNKTKTKNKNKKQTKTKKKKKNKKNWIEWGKHLD